jgi:rhodanese-related sulfurtransferase
MKLKFYWLFILILVLGLVLSACGGDQAESSVAEPVEEVAAEPATEVPPTEVPPTEVPPTEVQPTEEPAVEEVAAASEAELDAAFGPFLASMVKYNTIGLDSLNEQLAGDPPPFLLDVRQPDELEEKGHIEGAINIPLRELGQNLDKLPSTETPIVSYCGSGWRCTIAMTELGALGFEDVLSLKGGSYGGWLEGGYPVIDGAAVEAEILNAAELDPALIVAANDALVNIPEGWGGITAEQLATELAENPELIVIDVRTQEELDSQGYI